MTAQDISFEQAKPYLNVFQARIGVPQDYSFYSVKKVFVDRAPAYLFRYGKGGNNRLKGEHFSFIVSQEDKKVLGFTHMDKIYSKPKMLSKKEAVEKAKNFLLNIDKSLAKNLENLWIKRHEEEVILDDGESVTVAGMKYKCYDSLNDDYAWVIVGYDGSVITYERNIRWNSEEQRRITEKWLHDNWLFERL